MVYLFSHPKDSANVERLFQLEISYSSSHILCYGTCTLVFRYCLPTQDIIMLITAVPDSQMDDVAALMMSNILTFSGLNINHYHAFSLLERFMKTSMFSRVLINNQERVTGVSTYT